MKQIATKIGYETSKHLTHVDVSSGSKSQYVNGKGTFSNNQEYIQVAAVLASEGIELSAANLRLKFYPTLFFNKKIFHPLDYGIPIYRSKKKFYSLVMLNDGSIGILKKIYKIGDHIRILVELRKKIDTKYKHVNLLQKSGECEIFPVHLLSNKLIFIEGDSTDYFCKPPNKIEIE